MRVYNVTCWKAPVFISHREIEAESAEQAIGQCGDNWDQDDFEECDRSYGSPVMLRAEAENDEEDAHEVELDPVHLRVVALEATLLSLYDNEARLSSKARTAIREMLPKAFGG